MNDELPEGWVLAELSSAARVRLGRTPGRQDYRDAGKNRVVKFRDLTARGLSFSSTKAAFVADEVASSGALARLCVGDVLLTASAHSGDQIGKKTVFVDSLPGNGSTSYWFVGELLCVTSTPQMMEPRWPYLWFLSEHGFRAVQDAVAGVHLTTGRAQAIPIPLPSLAEQRRIVAAVETLLARVNAAKERLDRVPGILKRFRQAVLAAACSGRLTEEWRARHPNTDSADRLVRKEFAADTPDAVEHLDEFELPASWVPARVDTLLKIQNGRAFPSKQYCGAEGVRLLRPGNLHVSGRVEWNGDNTACLPRRWAADFPEYVLGSGELLMNLTAQSLKDEFLGRACIKDDDAPALLNQRIARFQNHGSVDVRRYLLLYFKSKLFRKYVDGLDTGSLIRHMHSKDVGRHVLPLPPLEEQCEVVRRVAALFQLADRLADSVASAMTSVGFLPQAILARAFRGELVPTEAELARREGREFESAEELLARVQRADASADRGTRRRDGEGRGVRHPGATNRRQKRPGR